tara:strand:+ start:3237 stop:3875 length:639 start_codon:yes stop_codon:yes gene_type:complete
MRTTLQAVQEMARRLGKHPPAALDTGGTSIQAQLERVLDDASNTVQSEGWFWNTKYDVTASALGEPDGVVRVKISELEPLGTSPETYATIYHVDTEPSEDMRIVRKGNYLYDLKNNTDSITSNKKVRYSYQRQFGEVPEAFQSWIIALASFNFNRYYIGDKANDGALQMEMQEARRQATREEIRSSDINVLDTQAMRQIRGRRRTPDRSIYE